MMMKKDLGRLLLSELKALAKKNKVALPAGAKKDDIVRVLAAGGTAAKGRAAETSKAKTKAGTKAKSKATGKAKTKARVKAKAKPPAKAAGKGKTKVTSKPKVTVKAKGALAKKAAVKKTAAGRAVRPLPLEPLPAQELVTVAKFFTGAPEHEPEMLPQSLPSEYGVERIAVLARDPDVAFVYWEVPQQRLEQARSRLGGDSRLCVRIYDVTGVSFDGTNAIAYFDQDVYERIGSWYFDLRRPGRTVCADIGVRSADGRFLSIARSNRMAMPRGEVSDVLDEEWMSVEEEFLMLYGLPRWAAAAGGLSSREVQELLRSRRLQDISSPGAVSRPKAKRK